MDDRSSGGIPVPASPLRGARASASAVTPPQLRAAEYPNLGYVTIRGLADDAGFVDAVRSVIGAALPTRPRSVVRCAGGVVLWQSPDEWWLLCARADKERIVAALVQALSGRHAQVVDNSGGYAALHVDGAPWGLLLRHLSPYDFDALAPGQCVATTIVKASFTVVRTGASSVMLVFRRSFADYVWQLIDRAALPYGLALVPAASAADPLFSALLGGDVAGASDGDSAMRRAAAD